MNRFRKSMEGIRASEELKTNTLKYLEEQRKSRECRKRHLVSRIALAAVCLLIFLAAGGYTVYREPVSYISIDVNPSVELGLNRFGRVVSAEGYNRDGKDILEQLALNNLPYMKAIERLLENERYVGLLREDSLLVFTVISEESDSMIEQLLTNEAWNMYDAFTYTSDKVCREEAHQNEMSFGKYRAYLELAEYDESITVEDCHGMTMQEIQKRINSCGGHGDTEKEENHSRPNRGNHGGHHGAGR